MTPPSTRQRLRELAQVVAKHHPLSFVHHDAAETLKRELTPDVVLSLLSSLDRMEAVVRAAETERDAYRAMLCDLLAAAHPHPVEHPTMAKQWDRARELLKNGPNLASAGSEEG